MINYARLALAFVALPVAFALPASSTGKVWDVSVGANGKLAYDPPYIYAESGDLVKFTFHPKNHTVTQSSFNDPCTPLYNGFDSGFMPVASEDDVYNLPNFHVKVQHTDPIWVHCRQPGPPTHCSKGMVFAINPGHEGAPNSFSNFLAKATATGDDSTTNYASPSSSDYSDYATPTSYGGGSGYY